jgi:hypothetical protein
MFSNSHHTPERRSSRRAMLRAGFASLVLALAVVGSQAPAGDAVLVPKDGSGGGSIGSAPPCATVPPSTWTTSPRVLIHTAGLPASESTADQLQGLVSQAEDAVGQLNDIGASSAHVASVATTTKPFAYESTTFGDSMPTIHVGFVSHKTITADNDKEDAGGLTSLMYMASCSPTVTIEFPVDQGSSWSFSSPFTKEMTGLGVRYYDAGDFAPAKSSYPGTWFRPSFLHELLHAFGLNHTSSAYAMMNHRGADDGFPWGNRGDADAVRPLPDDVRLLRASYPASGTRWDVDALNMWYVVTSVSKGGAADQVKLCTPSLGTSFLYSSVSEGPCGTGGPNGGSISACPGDTLYTRYALNNYSTGSVHVTSTLSLSSDETSDATDALSATTRTDDLSATTSKLVEAKWKVPNASGALVYKLEDLHPIVHLLSEHINADGSADPNSLRIAWIPLRGTIDISSPCSTSSAAGSSGTPPTVKQAPVRSPGPAA